ncbi:MAG: archease [candidate division WOR-3 bacterium]|nr:archease [candidate division WOR-3 bacterium]
MPYKYLNHTADLGIEVEEETIEELFISTARAIFDTQIEGEILKSKELSFEIAGESLEELLIEWCRELIYNFSVKGFIPVDYKIDISPGFKLNAWLVGDNFDQKRHKIKLEVKNATYHNLSVKKINGFYRARIIFDV